MLKMTFNKEQIILDYGSISAFAKQYNFKLKAVHGLLDRKKGTGFFHPNSEASKAYIKLKELGYVSVTNA
ncbi:MULTISPECIES: hypothetical protein [unclassified Campylobacter]|uniref:hypothetical protein n=1 Tax=unclassified Campylobacter TaxID=2593542 RepID=UPI003D327F33